jgi:hypothetical protein
MTWRRSLLGLAAATVLVVAGAVAAVILPPRQTGEVPMPARDARPEQVVAAFTEALDVHDCTTARALTAAGGRDLADAWCDDVAGLADITVGPAVAEDPSWSAQPAGTEVVNVPVSFELTWRWWHDDGSMSEGPTTWGYRLVRADPQGAWRIVDQGVG